MPRKLRYPASPVQEIFFSEPIPFGAYDTTSASQPNPPAIVSVHDCRNFQSRYYDALKQSELNNTNSNSSCIGLMREQLITTKLEYNKCLNDLGSTIVREKDIGYSNLRSQLGPSGSDYRSLGKSDNRIGLLQSTPPPFLDYKFNI